MWRVQAEVDRASSSPQHREVMGSGEHHSGSGLEQERFYVKATSQGSQGAWTRWNATVNLDRRLEDATIEEEWPVIPSNAP